MKKHLLIFLAFVLSACGSQPENGDEMEMVYSLNSIFLRQGDKMAVSDEEGTPLTPYEFDDLEGLSNGNILAYKDGLYFILDSGGSRVMESGFDEFSYCFNGCAIVRDSIGYGLLSLSGKQLLPTEYCLIRFITPNLAAAVRGGHTTIVDCYGNAIAQTTLPMDSIVDNIAIYNDMYAAKCEANRAYWDKVLDSYQELCSNCLEAKMVYKTNREAAKGMLQQLLEQASAISEELKGASGQMTPQQLERFRLITERYSDYEK